MTDNAKKLHFLDVQRDPTGAADAILQAVDRAKGSMGKAAEGLGIGWSTLNKFIKHLSDEVPSTRMKKRLEDVRKKHEDDVRERQVRAGRRGGRPPVREA